MSDSRKFKVGDRLRRIHNNPDIPQVTGKTCIVMSTDIGANNLIVEFDDPAVQSLWKKYCGSLMYSPPCYFELAPPVGFSIRPIIQRFENVDDAIAEATRLSTLTGIPHEVVNV